jgi:hypothetical protein
VGGEVAEGKGPTGLVRHLDPELEAVAGPRRAGLAELRDRRHGGRHRPGDRAGDPSRRCVPGVLVVVTGEISEREADRQRADDQREPDPLW